MPCLTTLVLPNSHGTFPLQKETMGKPYWLGMGGGVVAGPSDSTHITLAPVAHYRSNFRELLAENCLPG